MNIKEWLPITLYLLVGFVTNTYVNVKLGDSGFRSVVFTWPLWWALEIVSYIHQATIPEKKLRYEHKRMRPVLEEAVEYLLGIAVVLRKANFDTCGEGAETIAAKLHKIIEEEEG